MDFHDFSILGGWLDDPKAVRRTLGAMPRPLFASAAGPLAGSGSGKTALLYRAFSDVNGAVFPEYPPQTVGDCVGHAFGHGVDVLAAVQIARGGRAESFRPTCTEAVYAMARVAVGGIAGDEPDGAVGAWAAHAVSRLGTVSRDVVGPYDGQRSRLWGTVGVPDEIAETAKRHRVHTVSLIQSYDELADAVVNGYPVAVCSNQGFTRERDAQGFCAASGVWAHCMLVIGVRADERPGACFLQSWGPAFPSGPLALDQPSCSFWVDRPVVERMTACGDTWSLSSFDGYPAQALPSGWGYDGFA